MTMRELARNADISARIREGTDRLAQTIRTDAAFADSLALAYGSLSRQERLTVISAVVKSGLSGDNRIVRAVRDNHFADRNEPESIMKG
ncbi:MAG: hypothetical protein AB1529_04895 [Candidatus Micrarchaeota archaeon]